MTRAGGTSARFRQRKLSTKQPLQILREDQVEKVDDDQPRNIPKVDTGVEKAEEIEHHLQAAISASQAAAVGGKVAQIYIPTPDTIKSSIQYDRLYPPRFSQPATYIRFSSTVEECTGVQYCINAEDEQFLQSMNQKKSSSARCSVDDFEEVMDFFEQISKSKQPFAVVDNAPVINFEEMSQSPEFFETVNETARTFAADIYEHWKQKRMGRGNKALLPTLKVETGQETDDGDPYVCFRRREVRQARKTRGRDAQSIEKLRKLRRELEDARKLIALVKQREVNKAELLGVEGTLFDQRVKLKETKRKLGIKADDEDLLNQKPQKKPVEPVPAPRTQGPPRHLSLRPDVRSAESDLVSLQDVLREKEINIQKDIEEKMAGHGTWLDRCPDFTMRPLLSPPLHRTASSFRAAVVQYLPSPPESAPAESPRATSPNETSGPDGPSEQALAIRYRSPPMLDQDPGPPSYRRRIGRGGRLMIDRRGMQMQSKDGIDPMILDRFKFDRDDDDDDSPVFTVDPDDQWSIQYRVNMWTGRDAQAPRQAQLLPRDPNR